MMTEKEVLETRIKHLESRLRLSKDELGLVMAKINFELTLLKEELAIQNGFCVGGKYGFRFEVFNED